MVLVIRFYGASSVCYSCRIFFRRIVSSNDVISSCSVGGEACKIDKTSRNNCKKCRYEKCLSVGLLPYLVNKSRRSSKNIRVQEESKSKDLAILPRPTEVQPVNIIMVSSIPQQSSSSYFDRNFEQEFVIMKVEEIMEIQFMSAFQRDDRLLYWGKSNIVTIQVQVRESPSPKSKSRVQV